MVQTESSTYHDNYDEFIQTEMKMLIAVAHGSRNSEWRASVERQFDAVRSELGTDRLRLAYMDLSLPSVIDVVTDAVQHGSTQITILPLFLADEGHVALGPNRSPSLRWTGAPEGTRSFAVICHDPDVPSRPDRVNKEGMTVPEDLPRVDFFHWVLVDIPAGVGGLAAGADSEGVTPRGKAPVVSRRRAAPTGDPGENLAKKPRKWRSGHSRQGG